MASKVPVGFARLLGSLLGLFVEDIPRVGMAMSLSVLLGHGVGR